MNEASRQKHEHEKVRIEIEPATPDDAEVMCSIRDEAWLATYPNEKLGITEANVRVNAQGLDGEFVPRRVAWLKDKITNTDGNWKAYVGKVDDEVRGFVIASTDDKGRNFLNSIYVKPRFQGEGIGSKLMQKALDWLGRDEDIYLEVANYNDNAISFYERLGFVKTDNEVREEIDRPSYITPIPQLEMILRPKPEDG